MQERLTIQRTLFFKACMEKDISKNTVFVMAEIIKRIRERKGHPAAEKKAEELREIIERSETEEEILAAIATMETTGTKNDTRE